MKTQKYIAAENKYCAPNYLPIPVVLAKGEGIWLWDIEGKKYMDMMSAYSAVSHGHCHPRLVEALHQQSKVLTVCSRAYYSDKMLPFLQHLCELTGLDSALPMNTGAEAVETAIKAARRWGYQVKKIPKNKAEIIVAKDNFHGRTTTVISFSTEKKYKEDFGPFTPGFNAVEYFDIKAFEQAITPNTCAILVEPMQGEAGIKIPPQGWLKQLRNLCDEHNILLLLDEVQTGFGRTGKNFAFQHENIMPDGLILGKALGGGILPVSAFVAKKEILQLMKPGSHGTTFGGNPLAATIALEAMKIMQEDNYAENSRLLGDYMINQLKTLRSHLIKDIRGKGLWIGIEFDHNKIMARSICESLMKEGILSKETHDTVVRLAPPLIIDKNNIDIALDKIFKVINKATKVY